MLLPSVVHVKAASFLKESVDSISHFASHAAYGTEHIRAGAEVSLFAKELHGTAFFLKRIVLRRNSQNFKSFKRNFNSLSGCW